jgi:hypothetical protein
MSGERGGQGIGPCLQSHTTRAFLHSRHYANKLTEKRKDGRLWHLLAAKKKTSSVSL